MNLQNAEKFNDGLRSSDLVCKLAKNSKHRTIIPALQGLREEYPELKVHCFVHFEFRKTLPPEIHRVIVTSLIVWYRLRQKQVGWISSMGYTMSANFII